MEDTVQANQGPNVGNPKLMWCWKNRHERWFQVEGSINLLQTSLATVVSETMLPGRGHVPIVFSWHLASSLDLADQASVGVLE